MTHAALDHTLPSDTGESATHNPSRKG